MRLTDVDGELDIGAEVAKPDDPLTWLPAVENFGEGFFFALKESELVKWEEQNAGVRDRQDQFRAGFKLWQRQRDDRKRQKDDFANARFVLLHSLSHLLITAVSLDCGYSASSIRERIYAGAGGVVDERWAFVTSANFTEAAQERNIEAGVLLDHPRIAEALAGRFRALRETGRLRRM